MFFILYTGAGIITFKIMNMVNRITDENELFDAEARLLKVLTHPVRLAILNILRDGEHCVCHMEAYLGYRQAYISQQLMVLREAGLIQDRRDGWNVYYQVIEPRIYEVLSAVEQILLPETAAEVNDSARVHPSRPSILAKRPVTACPCPQCSGEDVK